METNSLMNQELNPKNYKRICLINWILTVPLVVLFAVPYLSIATFINANVGISYVGALLFSLPFCLTILHGHVTMALGSLHRNHYYEWLEKNTLSYGLFFHPLFTSTRFRLILLVISIMVLSLGWVIQF